MSFREAAARCWRGCSLAGLLALCPLPAAALHAAAPAPASDFHTVTRWAMDEGLPHNLVHSVAQGADGLLWVGTWEGVARFNGRGFTVYDRQNTPGVELGGVFVVMRDPQGGMLFGTAFDGVYRLYRGRWERIGDREARHLQVNALLRDRAGVLWVGSAQTLYRLGEDGRLVDVGHDAGLPEARVTALHETDDRALMVGTERGLYRIDPGTRRATAWGAARGMAQASVRRLAGDRDGGLLAAGDDGLWWWRHDGTLQRFRPGERVDAVLQDRQGRVWMSLSSGRLVVHAGQGRADQVVPIEGAASPALIEDAEGLIWAGSTHGLFRVTAGAAHGLTHADGLTSDYVRSVLQTDDGSIWIGSAAGLDRWRDGAIQRVALLPDSDGRPVDQSVLALAATGDGGVWAGTYNQGVLRLDARGQVGTRIGRAQGLPSPFVRALLPDGRGGLWIGTMAGLSHYRDGRVRAYGAAQGIPESPVQALYRDEAGTLWLGTDRGMAALRADGSRRTWQGERDLPAQSVFDFFRDEHGDLWIASDRGLLRLRGEQFSVYDHRVGLPRDKLFRIIDDGRGFFWLSSNHGVFRVARVDFDEVDAGLRRQLGVDVVDRSDGMPANQGNGSSAPAGWLAHSGDLMFPTSSGLGVIDPMRVGMLQQHRLPIVFERVAADGVVQALQPAFRFEADTRRIVVGYAGLSFRAPDKVRYRYRLEGFDPDWVDAGSATEAIYTNLPPGRYRFQVQAMTLPVDWTREEVVGSAALALTLTPPWWRREGVLGAGLLLLAGVLSALYLWRIARFRQQQRTLGRVIDARTRELSDKNLALLLASQEREDLVRRLEYQASHDVLTGLPNRREAERFMQARVEQALAEGGRLSLVLADIDHFKRINDDYGHEVGDDVLRQVGAVLAAHADAGLFAARHGGEEFLLIATGLDAAQARALFERIRRRIGTVTVATGAETVRCTASMGMVELVPALASRRELLAVADRRLYAAKRQGRDRLVAD